MKLEDISDLLSLCDKASDALEQYDRGVDYQNLQIATIFQTITAPLVEGDKLESEFRKVIPATKLHLVTRSVFQLRSASSYTVGQADARYGSSLQEVKSSLEDYRRTLLPISKAKIQSIFYSWQATSDNSTNRGFIRKSLDKAIKELNKELEVEDSLRVDSDISERPGSPKIFDAVLQKIDSCHIFVADVSLVADSQSNSNVMLELGYALKVLGAERILMIFNEASGHIRDLPFDLGFNTQITYSCSNSDVEKAPARNILVGKLTEAIGAILEKGS